ncbi:MULTISPECIES: AAA family ATPase [Geobacter]|uniref:ATPase AAA n=2 Tax=Geobacter TaxID=28231 RepID=A0A0C1TSZ9_9BACT|nr:MULTISPECIES: AAA family ATPase [Geobacter]KIE42463.1 ATPase AAA [Geobacter soli]MBE2887178.1 AAA family ATPase [Geobacter anodireducens]
MYRDHFGFTEQPFALTPNPDFLFLSTHHQEGFAHLLYGIDTHAGFIELTGEVGTGKTTLIRTFLNQLDPATHRTALIFNPTLSSLGLLQGINREFGLPCASSERGELLEALNRFLLEESSAGRTVVLVIDEAQNLSAEVLEHIRLISNLETERDKLIQIVLVGQPELKRLLALEELRQLNQRITVRYHLEPMGCDDTREYIRHRIRVAGGGREPVAFTLGAVKKIYRFSKGLPRLINAVCDRALLLAYTRDSREITASMAAEAIIDVRQEEGRRFPLPRKTLQFLTLAAAISIGVTLFNRAGKEPSPPAVAGEATPAPAPTAAPAPQPPPLTGDAVRKSLAATAAGDNMLTTANALLGAWQAPAIDRAGHSDDIRTLAARRGFTATEIKGSLDDILRFDAPVLLQVELPDGTSRFLTLTAASNGSFTVVPAVAGKHSLSRGEIEAFWEGRAWMFWKNFHGIPLRTRAGSKGKGVKPLQELLKGAGFYDEKPTGDFDAATEEGIRRFQQSEGLQPDGKAGEKTLALLYRRAGGFFPPGLTGAKGSTQ